MDWTQFEAATGHNAEWARHNCHGAALALVKSGVLGEKARVARGFAKGVGSQHSWVVIGDPYLPAEIIDPTIWSYEEPEPEPYVARFAAGDWRMRVYHPHGEGVVFAVSMPQHHGGETIQLDQAKLSNEARRFLTMLGSLDALGWSEVAHLPHDGWPHGEIIDAMCDVPRLMAMVPIDIVGMVTDRNPNNLYLQTNETRW